ncbi:MAG: ABC transporter permease, partial [Chloroflexi bacterium]
MADKEKKTQAQTPKTKSGEKGRAGSQLLQTLLIPILAVFTGLVIGAFVIAFTDAKVIETSRNFFSAPGAALKAMWDAVALAYGSLFYGSIGSPREMWEAITAYFSTGQTDLLLKAFYPITESLATSTPYIFAGLAVAIGFRCGLFNIGAEGQFGIGALAAAFVGYSLKGLPWFVHLPLAILGGALGGAAWGAIPGYLKAKFGAHEVVNTIMMNYISYRLSDWLLNGPMKATGYRPITPTIEVTAELPRLFPEPLRLNWGFFLALAVAY